MQVQINKKLQKMYLFSGVTSNFIRLLVFPQAQQGEKPFCSWGVWGGDVSPPHPGINSWVLAGLYNPAYLDEPSKQITQVSWVLELTTPSLAGFVKTNKKPVLAGFAGFVAKATMEPSLPGLAGLNSKSQVLARFALFMVKSQVSDIQ